ncbi:uncharacterized protein LOC119734010 isoform X1 [Patiria miniata]|uniref:BEN domain-containing protein n=1 Tax=Patiria miniata TaxID=46514 RepID=A0A914AIF1_PATMI|nr:uncharacterized protein LOC119734010 isoform X1 [Patiria miniata]
MPPKYALLYFIKDRVFDIVRVSQIQKFNPKDEHDFVKDKVHMVEWSGTAAGSKSADLGCKKYPAVIIKLSESENQLQKVLDSDTGKRIRIPNVTNTTTEPEEQSEDEVVERQKRLWDEAKKKKKAKASSGTKRLKDILAVNARNPLCNNVGDSSDEENIGSQRRSQSGLTRKRTMYLTDSDQECSQCKRLFSENKQIKEQNQKLRLLNIRLQANLLDKLEGLTGLQVSTKEQRKAQHSCPAPVSMPSPPAGRNVGDNTSLLDPEEVRVLDRKRKPSLFTKNLCVRLIGSEKLRNSSLDGRIPSRGGRAPRDALDPHIVETIKDLVTKRYGEAEKRKSTDISLRKLQISVSLKQLMLMVIQMRCRA